MAKDCVAGSVVTVPFPFWRRADLKGFGFPVPTRTYDPLVNEFRTSPMPATKAESQKPRVLPLNRPWLKDFGVPRIFSGGCRRLQTPPRTASPTARGRAANSGRPPTIESAERLRRRDRFNTVIFIHLRVRPEAGWIAKKFTSTSMLFQHCNATTWRSTITTWNSSLFLDEDEDVVSCASAARYSRAAAHRIRASPMELVFHTSQNILIALVRKLRHGGNWFPG
jgi:hypothetical protein